MKYSVLCALIGSSSALSGEPERSGQTQQYEDYGPTEKVQNLMPRRYERSANSNYVDGVHVKRTTFYSQLEDQMNLDDQMALQTPDQSRAAWQETRDASRAAAAEQERFQKEHNAMVAKNYADDTLETNTKKWHDAASRINMMNGGTTPFRGVANKLDSKYAQISTPDQSRAAWQETRDASRAAAAEQERFQKEHNAMVAKNYADDTLATNTKKWHDAASRINMMNGGTTPFRTVTNAKLDTMYAQQRSSSQYIDGSHPVDLYESNGADSNRDHKSPQIPAAMRGKEQQGWESKGNSHYWAQEAQARQQGWSNEINPWTTKLDFRTGDDMQKAKSTYTSLSQYIDGSHPVDLYESNGADSNRDHKSPQIPAAMRGKEQQGWQSPGNSHYWAQEAQARQSGWSNEINPWTTKLDFRSGDDMQKSKSTYTSLPQSRSYAYDNESDKSFTVHKAEASGVVSQQKSYETLKTADVEARNAKNSAETAALRNAVGAATTSQRHEFSNYYLQYVPEEELYLQMGTPFMTEDEYQAKRTAKIIAAQNYMEDYEDEDHL